MVLRENGNQERVDHWLLGIECGPLRAVIVGELVGKCCRTGAKIGCSMDGAANLADQNMQDMLPFVRDLLEGKPLFASQYVIYSVRRLKGSEYRLVGTVFW